MYVYIYIYTCLDMYRWRWLASLGNMIIYDILEILGYTSNMFEYTGNMIIYIYISIILLMQSWPFTSFRY